MQTGTGPLRRRRAYLARHIVRHPRVLLRLSASGRRQGGEFHRVERARTLPGCLGRVRCAGRVARGPRGAALHQRGRAALLLLTLGRPSALPRRHELGGWVVAGVLLRAARRTRPGHVALTGGGAGRAPPAGCAAARCWPAPTGRQGLRTFLSEGRLTGFGTASLTDDLVLCGRAAGRWCQLRSSVMGGQRNRAGSCCRTFATSPPPRRPGGPCPCFWSRSRLCCILVRAGPVAAGRHRCLLPCLRLGLSIAAASGGGRRAGSSARGGDGLPSALQALIPPLRLPGSHCCIMFSSLRARPGCPTHTSHPQAAAAVPRRAIAARAQAAAAPAASETGMRVLQASTLSVAQLDELTARPRVDFTSILGTVCRAQAPGRVERRVVVGGSFRQHVYNRRLARWPPPCAGGAHCGGRAATWGRRGARVYCQV